MTDAESTPLEDLRDAARGRAILAEARVVLAGRLGVPPGEALQHLIWLARDLDVELDEAAALVVAGAQEDGTSETRVRAPRPAPAPETAPEAADAPEVLRRMADADTADDAKILAGLDDDPAARAVLYASLDAAAHLVPVRGDGGRIVDFLYARLNAQAHDLFGRGPAELTGERLLRSDPGSALTGLFAEYVEVLEKGIPYEREPFAYTTAQDGVSRRTRMSVRCVPVPTGVCVTWRYHHEEDRIRLRLERAERLALIGFGEWDLATDELDLSPQTLANYGFEEPPADPQELSSVVATEDLPLVEDAMHTLFTRRTPVELEHRVVTSQGAHRHLWVFAEPVLDAEGRPVSVDMVSQDISRRRIVEQALVETRREILRHQARTAQERRVAVTLRRAILPDAEDFTSLPGLSVAIRSLAAESAARIGGDWFAARALPDGTSLLAIGDAAGHGLPAAAAMARTRNGLLGLAYTGRPPGELAAWLNELVGDLEPAATGTAVIAYFEPQLRVLQWACAGHPPPILVRGGEAVPLGVDPDPMLGALPNYGYATNTTRLVPGDLVFLYTDGLVERRDTDITDRIGRLTEILKDVADGPQLALDRVLSRMEHDRDADDTTMLALRVE
ncbi:SpoIIE family protein phosphatase [Spirillospora sp. CA-294931]|uniref:PP2C family protein-serine/threonine phosphatase n=1 Tax=Spirillospora sp. CA-294931 TaxID=3240042 RepID=UPI003D8A7D9F